MRKTNIRELKHETSKVLAEVEAGGTLELCRRGKTVALITPPGRPSKAPRPDFAARMREIYGDRVLETTGTDLMQEARGDR